MAAWCNGSHQHAIANVVSAYSNTELVDDSYRLMTNGQPRLYRIFPFEDVEVSAADRRQGNANDGFARSGLRDGDMFDPDLIGTMKNERPHS